jgi:peptidyl-prolyl cis-trans isomerase C
MSRPRCCASAPWPRCCASVRCSLGLLPRHTGLLAPELDEAERHVIEAMTTTRSARRRRPGTECLRYYDANKAHFIVGQALHVRHILFAVTPGVNVHALSQRAETALLELIRKDVPPGRFEQLAAELSNCPSSKEGGDLGWVTPEDCAPELANELFFQTDSRWGMGVHPRLVHTRFGLHIIEVLGRRKGKLPAFEEVQERIAMPAGAAVAHHGPAPVPAAAGRPGPDRGRRAGRGHLTAGPVKPAPNVVSWRFW